MRSIAAVALATSFLVTQAVAADVSAPLAAGKPAGVKQAQVENNTLFIIAGAGLVAAGIALAASGDNNVITPATTTTTTTTRTTTTTTGTTTG